jgi:hypothetical protein
LAAFLTGEWDANKTRDAAGRASSTHEIVMREGNVTTFLPLFPFVCLACFVGLYSWFLSESPFGDTPMALKNIQKEIHRLEFWEQSPATNHPKFGWPGLPIFSLAARKGMIQRREDAQAQAKLRALLQQDPDSPELTKLLAGLASLP